MYWLKLSLLTVIVLAVTVFVVVADANVDIANRLKVLSFTGVVLVDVVLVLFKLAEDGVVLCEVLFDAVLWFVDVLIDCSVLEVEATDLVSELDVVFFEDVDSDVDVNFSCWLLVLLVVEVTLSEFSLETVSLFDVCTELLFFVTLVESAVDVDASIVVEFWLPTVSLCVFNSDVNGASEAAKACWSCNMFTVNAPPITAVVFSPYPVIFLLMLCLSWLTKLWLINGSPIILNISISLIPDFTQFFPDL